MTIAEERSTCVYFDGSCPICSREIAFYKRNSTHKSFKWVDVANVETAGLFPQGLSREELLARFYVKTEAGQLLSGADAFILIWKNTPGLRSIGCFAGLPGVTQLLRGFYELFLWFRRRKA